MSEELIQMMKEDMDGIKLREMSLLSDKLQSEVRCLKKLLAETTAEATKKELVVKEAIALRKKRRRSDSWHHSDKD